MMDRDKMGHSGWRGLKNLGELASSDYPTFGAII